MPFATGPVLCYVGLGQYRTVGPTVYVGKKQIITIPSDFTTDLATVPRLFWALIPPHGAYERAAVLHDWHCTRLADGDCDISSRDTDGLFRRVMREQGVGPCTRWAMWVGVRWGALANPCRRGGWWRDAPAVLALSAVGALAAVAGLLGAHLAVDALLELADHIPPITHRLTPGA